MHECKTLENVDIKESKEGKCCWWMNEGGGIRYWLRAFRVKRRKKKKGSLAFNFYCPDRLTGWTRRFRFCGQVRRNVTSTCRLLLHLACSTQMRVRVDNWTRFWGVCMLCLKRETKRKGKRELYGINVNRSCEFGITINVHYLVLLGIQRESFGNEELVTCWKILSKKSKICFLYEYFNHLIRPS